MYRQVDWPATHRIASAALRFTVWVTGAMSKLAKRGASAGVFASMAALRLAMPPEIRALTNHQEDQLQYRVAMRERFQRTFLGAPIMLRVSYGLMVAACVGVAAQARGQSFIALTGQTSEPVTYYFWVTNTGTEPTPDRALPGARIAKPDVAALAVRDTIVPAIGSANLFKRAHADGKPAMAVTAGPHLQWWVGTSRQSPRLLEPSLPVSLGGITFTAIEPGTSTSEHSAPHVEGASLGLLGVCLVVASVLGHRPRHGGSP